MKNYTKKILCILVFLGLGSQQVVQAQSYQRWIYWQQESHQLSAQEMGEITEMLYNREISPDKVFILSNGVSLRIPQPGLFLSHIRLAVLSVRPWATSKEQVLDAIYSADRFKWGNDVNVRVKNYWVSVQNKKATFTNNYSGEGSKVFFLFVDGLPVIKCDCGNPLELLPEFYSFRHEKKLSVEEIILRSDFKIEAPKDFVMPRTIGEMATATIPDGPLNPNVFVPNQESSWWIENWGWFVPVVTTVVATGMGFIFPKKGYYWYRFFPKPIYIPGLPVDPTGPDRLSSGGGPVDPTGP